METRNYIYISASKAVQSFYLKMFQDSYENLLLTSLWQKCKHICILRLIWSSGFCVHWQCRANNAALDTYILRQTTPLMILPLVAIANSPIHSYLQKSLHLTQSLTHCDLPMGLRPSGLFSNTSSAKELASFPKIYLPISPISSF